MSVKNYYTTPPRNQSTSQSRWESTPSPKAPQRMNQAYQSTPIPTRVEPQMQYTSNFPIQQNTPPPPPPRNYAKYNEQNKVDDLVQQFNRAHFQPSTPGSSASSHVSLSNDQLQRRLAHQTMVDSPRQPLQQVQQQPSRIPPVQPALPRTPAKANTQSQFADTPVLHRLPPSTPVQLHEYKNSFSPSSPCIPVSGTRLPVAYTLHRQNMEKLKKDHSQLKSLVHQFGCSDLREGFSRLFHERFPGYSFPKEDTKKMMAMSDKLRSFLNAMKAADKKQFRDLLCAYQLYEKLTKMAYRDGRTDVLKQLSEVEESLLQLKFKAQTEISNLSYSFKSFIFDLTSYLSRSVVYDEQKAFQVYCEMNQKYTYEVKTRNESQAFAGLDIEYRQLIKNVREIRGTNWLNVVMEAYLNENYRKLNPGEKVSISIDALSTWINKSDENFVFVSEEVRNAVLEVKEKIGCWDDPLQGKSLAAFLNFHGQTGSIPYPYKELMPLGEKLYKQWLSINDPNVLKLWIGDVKNYFHPQTGWKVNAPIDIKEKAILIYCLDPKVDNALLEKAKLYARDIVHFMYTQELTNNNQE